MNNFPVDFKPDKISKRQSSEIWGAAVRQAHRSTMGNFQTGAIVFDDNTGEILSGGCSHEPLEDTHLPTNSQHAEADALGKLWGPLRGTSILVVTLTKANRHAGSSRPCYSCASLLARKGVGRVYYPERMNDNSWAMNSETSTELYRRGQKSGCVVEKFARNMNIL